LPDIVLGFPLEISLLHSLFYTPFGFISKPTVRSKVFIVIVSNSKASIHK